jgi:hypothetical protein
LVQNGEQIGPRSGAPADVLANAAWFAEGFDPRSGEFLFVATDRTRLAAQTFLDHRWDRATAERARIKSGAVTSGPPAGSPAPNLIWHTGFCCSTLLAKALDRTGCNLSLCEPQLLVDIAAARRTGQLTTDFTPAVALSAFRLLSRRFMPEESLTLKPSPAANVLLHEAAALTSGPMLFLFSDCASFVVSICKMGEDGRKYVRRLFPAILSDGSMLAKWPVQRLLSLSDLELAAIVWHMQIAEFLRGWPHLGGSRAASLDCDAFLASPRAALKRIDAFFSLGLGDNHIQQISEGPLFGRNAKTGEESFDAEKRRREHASIARQLGGELDRIVEQSYAICRSTPPGPPLPAPLLPIEKTYQP